MNATESKQPFERDPILCPRKDKDKYEALNLRELFEFTERFYPEEFIDTGSYSSAPFPRIKRDTILEMHRTCIQGIYPCAGSARPHHFIVQVKDAPDLQVTPAHLISIRLDDLCEEIERIPAGDKIQGIMFAPEMLHRITQIHPFAGGNGRVGRALVDLFLYRQRVVKPGIHIGYAVDEARDQYIDGLRAADDGDYQPLGEFITRSVLYLQLLQQVLEVEQLVEQLSEQTHDGISIERPNEFNSLTNVDARFHASAEQFLENFNGALEWQSQVLREIGRIAAQLNGENN